MASPAAASNLFSVAGKRVLVTGGSRGIGLMIAKGFADHGADVLIVSRDEKACQNASEEIGHGCRFYPTSLATREKCEALAVHVDEVFRGRLDVLVNNAGCTWGEPLEHNSGQANWGWDKVLDLNVKGLFYLTRACVPLLERDRNVEGGPGRVINIGSVAGLIPQEAPTHAYDVSKAAVHHLTKKLSQDLAPQNITVNAVAPGFVETRMSVGLGKYTALDKIASNVPLGRMGNGDDMAGACIYLSSVAGAYCTGVILNVDGGTVGSLQIPLSSL